MDRCAQIDFMIVPEMWKNIVKYVRTEPNTFMDSDHFLMIGKIRISLSSNVGEKATLRVNLDYTKENEGDSYNTRLARNWSNLQEQTVEHYLGNVV